MWTDRRALAALLAGAALAAAGCDGSAQTEARSVPAPPGPSRIWLTDVTAAAGLARFRHESGAAEGDYIIDTLGSGAAVLDYDGDGDPDIYLAQGAQRQAPEGGPPDRLYRNDGDTDGDGVPEFHDATDAAGLGDTRWSFGTSAADYDGDGDPDLLVLNWGPNRMYRNDGGRFTDVSVAAGLSDTRWGISAAWSDVDRDSDLDLYVVNYVEFAFERYPARGKPQASGAPPCNWRDLAVMCGPRGLEPAADTFYRNEGDRNGDGVPEFREATREAGLAVEPRYGLAAHFFDSDDDGDDDLYVANDSLRNTYFVNLGDGRFEEMALLSGLAYNERGNEQASMGIASADYDGDGRFDLVVTNFSHDHDTLYHNDGGHQFFDASSASGLGTASYLTLGWGVSWVDFDHDGWEDLYVAHGHVYPQVDERDVGTKFRQPDGLFRNRGDGTFEDLSGRAGPGLDLVKNTRAALPFDLEGDGDVDVLVTNLNDTPDLLRNEGARGGWLEVRLEGTRSNRDGIGARILVEAGGRRQLRQMRSDTGYAGSTLPIVHFGLGAERRFERLEVRWPSGQVSTLPAGDAGRRITLREP